uniref:Replication factor C C-terminal domain-containing protein n=1 Tax=viral metagenome TaxID=1070528 RepID=A0A6C0IEN6_9ZZZZ
MKFYETHFEEYINENNKVNLHQKLDKIYNKFPKSLNELKNLIFFGPNGTGKYTQMLKSIKKYSPSELKYEKKISLTYNKHQYYFKISDIHYEVDMSLLGCNSKLLWHEIYQQIIDIISAKVDKSGIIVCKYFQEIHSELLENFYSYMQKNTAETIDLKFIIITEELSFIPDNILNCCEIINISRPSKTAYTKCVKNKLPNDLKLDTITNIKILHLYNEDLMLQYKIICNKIIINIININDLDFLKFRDILYDIFIYNLDITDCIWYILSSLVEQKKILNVHLSQIMIRTYCFFQYYNNNYRPIYHLENYLFYLTKLIHNY